MGTIHTNIQKNHFFYEALHNTQGKIPHIENLLGLLMPSLWQSWIEETCHNVMKESQSTSNLHVIYFLTGKLHWKFKFLVFHNDSEPL